MPRLWPASRRGGPGFDRAQIHMGMGFVVDKVAPGQGLLPLLLFSAHPGGRAVCVCVWLLALIAGSNLAGGMDVSLF